MSNYKRLYILGGTYFFTVVTYKRMPLLCSEQYINRLRAAFKYTQSKYPFYIEGLVVLPDHLHSIWRLPEGDCDFSKRWSMIKRYVSMGFKTNINNRGEKNIWQRRFWEHAVRDEADFQRCLNYIYYNPVKHGYVQKPSEWIYSTFKRDVAKGLYDAKWGDNEEPCNIKLLDFE